MLSRLGRSNGHRYQTATLEGLAAPRPPNPPGHPGVRGGWTYLEGSATPEESEQYWCQLWLECGAYVLLYGVLGWSGHKWMALATSRDGFHFTRVGQRPLSTCVRKSPTIALNPSGSSRLTA